MKDYYGGESHSQSERDATQPRRDSAANLPNELKGKLEKWATAYDNVVGGVANDVVLAPRGDEQGLNRMTIKDGQKIRKQIFELNKIFGELMEDLGAKWTPYQDALAQSKLDLRLEEEGDRTAKGNVTQDARDDHATLSDDRFPIFDKKSALAALKLRGHGTTDAERKKIINKAAKYASEAAKKAREADAEKK